jgi:putative FmdB family regulatory protein
MPTYKYLCEPCQETFEQWFSIHEADQTALHRCNTPGIKVYENVTILGKAYHDAERYESTFAKDRDAYKRFRDSGKQPARIDGCDRLEATASNEISIRTNGALDIPDHIWQKGQADAQDIMAGRL